MKYYVSFSKLTGEVEKIEVAHGNTPRYDGYITQMFTGSLEEIVFQSTSWTHAYQSLKRLDSYSELMIYVFSTFSTDKHLIVVDTLEEGAIGRVQAMHPDYELTDVFDITDIV